MNDPQDYAKGLRYNEGGFIPTGAVKVVNLHAGEVVMSAASFNALQEDMLDRLGVTHTFCGCRPHSSGNGDVPCHVCGQYVNVRCWNCRTPRGEGSCPNPVKGPSSGKGPS